MEALEDKRVRLQPECKKRLNDRIEMWSYAAKVMTKRICWNGHLSVSSPDTPPVFLSLLRDRQWEYLKSPSVSLKPPRLPWACSHDLLLHWAVSAGFARASAFSSLPVVHHGKASHPKDGTEASHTERTQTSYPWEGKQAGHCCLKAWFSDLTHVWEEHTYVRLALALG